LHAAKAVAAQLATGMPLQKALTNQTIKQAL
jgi:hypothetical protein